jgi:hypothetical protein
MSENNSRAGEALSSNPSTSKKKKKEKKRTLEFSLFSEV